MSELTRDEMTKLIGERHRAAYHAAGHLVVAFHLLPEHRHPLPPPRGVRVSLDEQFNHYASQVDNPDVASDWLVILAAGWIAEGMAQESNGAQELTTGEHMDAESACLSVLLGMSRERLSSDDRRMMEECEEAVMAADERCKRLLDQHWHQVGVQAEKFLADAEERSRWQVG